MEIIIKAANNYGEGLLTPREFLGILMDTVGKEWENMTDESKPTQLVNDLFEVFNQ